MAMCHQSLLAKRPLNHLKFLLVAIFFATISSGYLASPALADAPSDGIVIEGVSVPGVALGFTRSQVEAAYGPPASCSSLDQRFCQFVVEGGGFVLIRFHGPGGSPADASPDDIADYIRWYQAVDGWVTTAGINTTLAFNDIDAVLAAYPNATISYPNLLSMSIDDPNLGIHITYQTSYPSGERSVWMAIDFPVPTPPPPDEDFVWVTAIDLFTGKRTVIARVNLHDNLNRYSSGADVSAHWTLPNGSRITVNGTSNSMGYAYFDLEKAHRGIYIFTIDDVNLEGFIFDEGNSQLSASVELTNR